jgi:predicted nucleic acid-binding Zn finger protein
MKEIGEEIRDAGGLTPQVRERICRHYRDRGEKALAAVDSGLVRKYDDFFVVTGSSDEYIVEDDFCTCRDFIYRGRCCWHILAVRIAVAAGLYQKKEGWYIDRWKMIR